MRPSDPEQQHGGRRPEAPQQQRWAVKPSQHPSREALERLLRLEAERPSKGKCDEQHGEDELTECLCEPGHKVERENRMSEAQSLAVLGVAVEMHQLTGH